MRPFYTIAGGFLDCMNLPKEFKDFHYNKFIERKPSNVVKQVEVSKLVEKFENVDWIDSSLIVRDFV